MAVGDAVDPFGATVAGVVGLLPQATFPVELSVGQKGVSTAMIHGYVEDVTGRVTLRLGKWSGLPEELKDAVTAAGRDVVHNGAASYTQAARFPEQADKEQDTYAEVLWARYEAGLEELISQVAMWLADETPDASAPQGPIGNFPDAFITDDIGF